MGGFFGAISQKPCIIDLFYGTDYNSHLGTKRAGMVTFDPKRASTVRFTVWNATISAPNSKTNSTTLSEIKA